MAEQHAQETAEGDDRRGAVAMLSEAAWKLRRQPQVVIPYLLLGAVLVLVDLLRARDPVPAVQRRPFWEGGFELRIEFAGYPAGVLEQQLVYEPLLSLRPLYLLWGMGLQVLTMLATSTAAVLAIATLLGGEPRVEAVGRLFGYVLATDLLLRTIGSIDLLQAWLLALPVIFLLVYAHVRLFAVSGLLVAGHSIRSAIRGSVRITEGRSVSVLGLVLAVGVGALLLSSVPIGGTFLSTAAIAPLHAAAIVVLLELRGSDHMVQAAGDDGSQDI